MDRDLLSHLPVVLAVARRGGFAAAARELRTTPSNVSHAVRTVEKRLGLPLFARTTRSVALTEAGDLFVNTASGAVQELGAMWEALQSQHEGASGLLRINTPRVAMPLLIDRVLVEMKRRHPGVQVEYFFDDGLSDIVADGFDAGIRLGQMVAADMISVPLIGTIRAIVVGSAKYLSEHGAPTSIEQLKDFECIQYRMTSAGNLYRWQLRKNKVVVEIETTGHIVVNDMLVALQLARDGHGLCYTFEPLARSELESGTLVEVLPKSAHEQQGFSCYYPRRASESPKLRAFIDTAKLVAR